MNSDRGKGLHLRQKGKFSNNVRFRSRGPLYMLQIIAPNFCGPEKFQSWRWEKGWDV